MIVDTSALVAILRCEPECLDFAKTLDAADVLHLSAVSYLEFSILVDSRRDPAMSHEIDEIIERFNIRIEPVTAEQARIARQAYRDYGKGSGHCAQLNFGDCFSYALARVKRQPILFKGDDFVHTDLRPAIAR